MTVDWQFRISSVAAFCADLDGFCTQFGYPLLTVDDGNGGRALPSVIIPGSRFDFDVIDNLVVIQATDTAPAVTAGPHVNARGTAADGNTAALALIDTQIHGFFATLPTVTNDPPAPYNDVAPQVWHTTGNTTLVSPPPVYPKRVWA